MRPSVSNSTCAAPGVFSENAFDLLGQFFEHVVVVAENLHRQFGLRAFEHFVETHLDGLREKDVVVGIDFLEHRLDLLAQLRFGRRAARRLRPFGERLVENVNVALVRRHRVGGDFARADARKDARDFRKLCEQPVFDFDVGAQRFLHAHADRLVEHRGDRAFVELRHELRAEPREQPDRTGEKRTSAPRATTSQRTRKRAVAASARKPFHRANDAVVALREFCRAAGTKHSTGISVSASSSAPPKREHHGERHRMKHFPFDAGERENRNVNHRDDDDAKEHRRADLFARGEHDVHAFFRVSARPSWCCRCPSWRTMFSTMTTAPSMMRPKSIAPRLIKVSGDAETRHAGEREQK